MIRAQFMSKVQQRGLKKGAIFFTLPNYLGKPSLEPFIKLDVSIQEQVLTLEYFDENDEIRSKTFECPINDTTIFRLSNIHDKVKKASHFDVDFKSAYCWFSCLTKMEPKPKYNHHPYFCFLTDKPI